VAYKSEQDLVLAFSPGPSFQIARGLHLSSVQFRLILVFSTESTRRLLRNERGYAITACIVCNNKRNKGHRRRVLNFPQYPHPVSG